MNKEERDYEGMEQKEVRIRDLIAALLYKMNLIIFCMVVFAILVAGSKFIRDKKRVDNFILSDIVLTDDEAGAVRHAQHLEAQIQEMEWYRSESVLMNIDPYAENRVSLQYYIDTGYVADYTSQVGVDYAADLIKAYMTYVLDGGIVNDIYDDIEWKTDASLMGELLSVEGFLSMKELRLAEINENTFTLYVTAENEERAVQLADAVNSAIISYGKLLEEKIGAHTISLVGKFSGSVVNTDLAERQQKLITTIIDLQNKYDGLLKGFSADQMTVMFGEVDDVEEESVATTRGPSFSAKYFVLGAILGGLLGCIWIGAQYILNSKMKNINEIQSMYGLRTLGELRINDDKPKYMIPFIYHMICRLENRENCTLEEQKELIVTNLKVICKREKIQKVFIASSIPMQDIDKKIIEEIIGKLGEQEIQAVYGGNIVHNARLMEEMTEINNVILFERIGVTKYQSLQKEVKAIEGQKVNILGCVGVL